MAATLKLSGATTSSTLGGGVRRYPRSATTAMRVNSQNATGSRFKDVLLGVETITAVAEADLIDRDVELVDLGKVILDCRGEQFTRAPR